jgi:hypothetical protein
MRGVNSSPISAHRSDGHDFPPALDATHTNGESSRLCIEEESHNG